MTDEDSLKQLYMNLVDASINKDVNKLDNILANDYVLVHMTGMKQTKEDYINSVVNGELKYYEAVHEGIDINIQGDRAVVVGKTKTLASPFGMNVSWWRLKQELIMEKIDSKWIIKHSIASTY